MNPFASGPVLACVVVLLSTAFVGARPAAPQLVETVVNSAAALEAAPLLRLVEELRVGSVSEDTTALFHLIARIEVDEEGRIYVLDSGVHQVRVYAPDGRFLHAFGRPGQGPGEFLTGGTLAIARDTAVVLEIGHRDSRLHIFTTDGEHLHTRGLGRTPGRVGNVTGVPSGWLAWVPIKAVAEPMDRGPHFDTTLVARFVPSERGVGERLISVPQQEYHRMGLTLSPPASFLLSPLYAPSPRVAVARGSGAILSHDGSDYRIDVRDPSGTLRHRILGEVERIPVTDAEVEDRFNETVQRLRERSRPREPGGEGDRVIAAWERDARAVGRADLRPVLGRMWGSSDGHIIARRLDLSAEDESEGDDAAARWFDVLDPDGRIAGRFAAPEDLSIHQFDWPFLWVRVRDELDVPYVLRMRIEPAAHD